MDSAAIDVSTPDTNEFRYGSLTDPLQTIWIWQVSHGEDHTDSSIKRERLQLKRLWNSRLSIHKLPNELLVQSSPTSQLTMTSGL